MGKKGSKTKTQKKLIDELDSGLGRDFRAYVQLK